MNEEKSKNKSIYIIIVLALIILGIFIYNIFSNQTGRIEFILKDQANQPVIGATVNLRKASGKDIGTVQTGKDGKITYYKVRKGEYIIEITELPEGYGIKGDKAFDVDVKTGETSSLTKKCTRAGGNLTVAIFDNNKVAMEGIKLNIYDEEGYLLSSYVSDNEGKIYHTFLEDGVYYFKQDEEQEIENKENLDFTMYKITIDDENKTFNQVIYNY